MTHLPQEYIDHIANQSLDPNQLEEFIRFCHLPLRKSIRINTLKTSIKEMTDRFQSSGWTLAPIPWCQEGFWISSSTRKEDDIALGNTIEHLQGLFYLQEASSMLPAYALSQLSENANIILDMAAAPGSKTTQLASYMNNQGLLIANELSSSRLKVLHANMARCGVSNTCLTHFDAKVFGQWLTEQFDAILLDAPCGGEGTVRKDPNAMNNWNIQALDNLSSLQKELITSAYHALKPGGTLIYSTCTLSQEENQHVCEHLLTHQSDISVIPLNTLFDGAERCATEQGYLHVFPHIFDSEGFFVAAFKKQSAFKDIPLPTPSGKWRYSRVQNSVQKRLMDYWQSHFGFYNKNIADNLWSRDNEVWYFPDNTSTIAESIKMQRCGVKLAELHKNTVRTQHDFIMSFGAEFTRHKVDLNSTQALSFMQGQDLDREDFSIKKGECLMTYRNHPLGLGKVVNQRIKNGLPRSLVRDNPVLLRPSLINGSL